MNDKNVDKPTPIELLSNFSSNSDVANLDIQAIDDVANPDVNANDNDDKQN
jgi:hypothetical protein